MDILKTSKDPVKIQKVYDYLPRIPIQNHDDLMALYEAAKRAEDDVPLVAKKETYEAFGNANETLASRLKDCTDPIFQDDIVVLLQKEYDNFQHETGLHSSMPVLTTHRYLKVSLREHRVTSLIKAAGDGKNEKARAILWKIVETDKDGTYGQKAIQALGKIGKPEDLDRVIVMLEKNPRLRIHLGDFGSMVIPRVMREINDPNVPKDSIPILSSGLVQASSHEDIAALVPLLEHTNNAVRKAATDAIGRSLRSDDDELIKKMFSSSSDDVRSEVAVTVGEQAWNEKYVPLFINMLKNDPNYSNRGSAAYALGKHKVRSAVPALQQALRDPVPAVVEDASSALGKISGEKR